MRLSQALGLLLLACAVVGVVHAWRAVTPPFRGDVPVDTTTKLFDVRRLPNNPIITEQTDPFLREESARYGYVNINGPSLIRVPSWVQKPLGRTTSISRTTRGNRSASRTPIGSRVRGPCTGPECCRSGPPGSRRRSRSLLGCSGPRSISGG